MSKIIKKAQRDVELAGRARAPDILPSEGGGVLNKKVLDARKRSEDIINEATVEAERIRTDARAMLSRVRQDTEEAKKNGYTEGREEGLSFVTEQSVALANLKEKFYKDAEPEIIKLVMIIAEKVIGKMVRENESAIKSIVRQAVESSIGERIVVRLNPEDYKVVAEEAENFKDILDRTKRISFKEDETITKGGCLVETEVGTIDARLETQLKAIKKALEL